MKAILLAVLALGAVAAAAVSLPTPSRGPSDAVPMYKTHYRQTTLDHFAYSGTTRTYRQRVLVSDAYVAAEDPPVFLYAGNEGDISLFYRNSGFMFTSAADFGALLVFPESRYYGESVPDEYFAYLSADQVVADYAELLVELRSEGGFQGVRSSGPVIVWGGSLAGMYAAWKRQAYPELVAGAIAASAPLLFFEGMVDPHAFYDVVYADFEREGCGAELKAAIGQIDDARTSAAALVDAFQLCDADSVDRDALLNYVDTGLTYAAMTDYAMAADFLQPMPAHPVEHMCDAFSQAASPLAGVAAAINVYYNWTGGAGDCTNTSAPISGGLGDAPWQWQACTEQVFPIARAGLFPPEAWSLKAYADMCQAAPGVTPRPFWMETRFGGAAAWDATRPQATASRVFFSNGKYDPWSAGSVTASDAARRDIVAFVIEDGAHHSDLRFPDPATDSPSLVECRRQETSAIKRWIGA